MSQKSYRNNKSSVYLIPTPIGNMEDITIRAINILKEVEVIFSEDTRITKQLLKHFDINKKLIASHQHNESENKLKMLKYLEDGYDVGIVTDRGTPIISDPGYELAYYAIEKDYNVIGLPGATALIPALVMSGITPYPFLFYGFLNSKEQKRKKELEELKKNFATMIFYEAPHRIINTLENMLEILGNRKISIAREISKKFEEIYRGNIDEIIEQMVDAKGEFVIVVDGNKQGENYDNLTIIEHVNLFIKEGHDKKEAIRLTAKERNISKKEVYEEYHQIKK